MNKGEVLTDIGSLSHHVAILGRIARAMERLGYEGPLLHRGYEYTVLSDDGQKTRIADLACFATTPPSYRSACIGVITTNGLSGARNVAAHTDLGAPLVFEVGAEDISRWTLSASLPPRCVERIPHRQLEGLFKSHHRDWDPASVFRVKMLRGQGDAVQFDFYDAGYFPLLESLVKKKLDGLLRKSLRTTREAYRNVKGRDPVPKDLFRLVFRFIAAKIFRDRKEAGAWTTNDAPAVLKAVEEYYNTATENLPSSAIRDKTILDAAWQTVASSLNFQNLAADDLAFIYENTLVTEETRKLYGTHSTPPEIAEYIVRKLPFEMLDKKGRYVLEPCSGHGVFLLAAMRRLRDMLPPDFSNVQRHNYLKARLIGLEIDPFAVEVARLSLLLADYPNRNDWKIHNADVYTSERFGRELGRADVVLCNPPFEDFSDQVRRCRRDLLSVHQPEDLLLRVLEKHPSLLGFVMPKAFLSSSYRTVQRRLAGLYGKIELVALPDRIFSHSAMETVLVLASDPSRKSDGVQIACRSISEAERDEFLKEGREPAATTQEISATPVSIAQPQFSLWIPRLNRIWAYLRGLPPLGRLADIHRGVEYNIPLNARSIARKARSRAEKERAEQQAQRNREMVFSDRPKAGFYRGIVTASGAIEQFFLRQTSYLRIDDNLMLWKSHRRPWQQPKILANAVRLSRGPWRLAAVSDDIGLYGYANIYGIWPKTDEDRLPLVAILNSPLANAFIHCHATGKHNPLQVIEKIPVPELPAAAKAALAEKVTTFQRLLIEREKPSAKVNKAALTCALLEIDAEVLKLYDLPPALERELLETFEGHVRPVPFIAFTRYYPADFKAYVSLHQLISEEFRLSKADRLLKRLRPVKDKAVHEAFRLLE